jgi:vacuolar-type H+-ATPase subunit I/STV1
LLLFALSSIFFIFLSGSSGRECILVMWYLYAAFFCSMGWFERKLIVVSVVVGFLHMSISSFLCWRDIVSSRKSMELCSSYVVLSFILLCILLMYVFTVCKLICVALNMIRMSSAYFAYYPNFLVSRRYIAVYTK